MKKILLFFLLFIFLVIPAYALNLSRVKTWGAEVLTHTDLNAEFDNVLNHSITNSDVAAGAAIVASKLDLSTAVAIGATSASTGAFTTLTASGATTLNGTVAIGDAAGDTVHFNANTITFEGSSADAYETILTITNPTSADKTVTVPNATGTVLLDTDTANQVLSGASPLVFEGATANDFETILAVTDPTTPDKTITLPNITGTVVTSAGSGGNIDVGAYEVRAQTFQSDVATSTAPFIVASTTKVANLNADTLDGYNTATTATANTIYRCGADNYMPDDTVDTTALKTAQDGSATCTNCAGEKVTLPGGEYGFYPQISTGAVTARTYMAVIFGDNSVSIAGQTTPTSVIVLGDASSGDGIVATQRYVTASGIDYWIFLKVDKTTGDIKATFSAADHPSYGNGVGSDVLPHPFTYDSNTEFIILIEKEQAKQLKDDEKAKGLNIYKNYKVDMSVIYPYIPMHSGKVLEDNGTYVLQMIDTIPDYITIRKLVLMTEPEKQAKEEAKLQRQQQMAQDKADKKERVKQKLGLTDNELKELEDYLFNR